MDTSPEPDADSPAPIYKRRQVQVRLTRAEVEQLVAARQAGMKINDLAAEFGIHRTTVMAHLKRCQI